MHAGPAHIIIQPSSVFEISGCGAFSATCIASAASLQSFNFIHNGQTLSNDSRATITIVEIQDQFFVAILQLCMVTAEDTGEYSCVIDDGRDQDLANFSVQVINEEGEVAICM